MDNPHAHTHFKVAGLFICFVGFLLIFFTILLRIEPTLLAPRLTLQFQITPNDLDNLIVKYQFALLLTLVLAGALIDKFGTRLVVICAILLATIGHYWLSSANTVHELFLGRIAIAFAHPFILIGVLKLGAEWLPKKIFALYAGIVFAILLLTPQVMVPIIYYSVNHTSWQTTLTFINIAGALLALALVLTYRYSSLNLKPTWQSLLILLKNPNVWLISLISCFGWIENTFLLNWGGSYLHNALHFDALAASSIVNQAFSCFAIGAVAFGLATLFVKKKYVLITKGYFLAAIFFFIAILFSLFTSTMIPSLLFLSALCAGTAILCYAKIGEYATTATLGLAFGLIAFITTGGNTLFAMLMVRFLGPITTAQPASAWLSSLLLIPLGLFIGGLIAIKLRKNLSK